MLTGRLIPFAEGADSLSHRLQRSHMIVQVGRDMELLRLRARVIGSAGHRVRSVTPDEATEQLQNVRESQVWVFCHTVEVYELALLAVAIRRSRPADKLLCLNGLERSGQTSGLFDELLEPVEGIDDLLRVVDELARPLSAAG